jgi:2-methylisocitrate lyase-like PEP mutase family enzyme
VNTTRAESAAHLHSLHVAGRPLLLPNAWDVASARLIEEAGAAAVATTSAGTAWSLGRPDGDALGRDIAVAAIARIAAAVSVPVTADIEGGYADDADGVERTVDAVLGAGAVGINVEDGARDPAEFAARVGAARRAADRAGVPAFVNARTDVFLSGLVEPDRELSETVDRARRVLDAGADGVFVPGVVDLATVEALCSAIPGPVNVMVGPGSPTVAELAGAGVARVSLGSGIAQAAYAVARRAAVELLGPGTYDAVVGAVDHGDLNALVAGR